MTLFPACINSPLEPNGGISGCVEFLEFILQKVVEAFSLRPPPLVFFDIATSIILERSLFYSPLRTRALLYSLFHCSS